jgi:hypothetical protein
MCGQSGNRNTTRLMAQTRTRAGIVKVKRHGFDMP